MRQAGWRESLNARGTGATPGQPEPESKSSPNLPSPPSAAKSRVAFGAAEVDQAGPEDRGGRSLIAVLYDAVVLLLLGQALKPDDRSEVASRKMSFVGLLVWEMPGLVALLIAAASTMYNVPSLLVLIACALLAPIEIAVYIVLRRSGDLPVWGVPLVVYTHFVVVAPLFAVALPGLIAVPVAVAVCVLSGGLQPPHNTVVSVLASLTVCFDLYNTAALRHSSWTVAARTDAPAVLSGLLLAGGAVGMMAQYFFIKALNGRWERERQSRDACDALVMEAITATQRFDLGALDNIVARMGDMPKTDDRHDVMINGIAEAVARYRPHVPHYVLDAAVMANWAPTGPSDAASAVSRGNAITVGETGSQRHFRRADMRGKGGASEDVQSSRSRVSKYAGAAEDVGSVRSRRSEMGGSVADMHTSPIYLARARPIVHRRITVAHLEFYVPNDLASTRAFALLVDAMLERASEFDATIHTLVGDVAVVSWNTVKSVRMSEMQACLFCAEVSKFVRNDFTKRLLAQATTSPSSKLGLRSSVTGADFSLSSSLQIPRIAGAVVTGDSRVCFAGSTSYEFCMSLPSLQPILNEFRKYATQRGMICIDAPTRNGAGRHVRARAVDAIGVLRRTPGTSAFGKSTTQAIGNSSSHTQDDALVELAKSPSPSKLGDSLALQMGDSEETPFDIVIYEVTSLTPEAVARAHPTAMGSSLTPAFQVGASFDAGDEPAFPGMNLGDAPARSPSHRTGVPPQVWNAKAPAATDDPDDLVTKGIHLAAMERRFGEAAKRFKDAADILQAKVAQSRPRGEPSPANPTHLGDEALPLYGNHDGEDADDSDAGDASDILQITGVTTEQFLQLANHLHARALKCSEVGARSFATTVATTNAQ